MFKQNHYCSFSIGRKSQWRKKAPRRDSTVPTVPEVPSSEDRRRSSVFEYQWGSFDSMGSDAGGNDHANLFLTLKVLVTTIDALRHF